MTNKVYLVETVEVGFGNNPSYHDFNLVNISYSYEKAIEFIKTALADDNSGIEDDDMIQITTELIDEYFGASKFVGRHSAKEWILKEGEENA